MKHASKTRLILELPVQLKNRLEAIASTSESSSKELALDAIRSFVDLQEWQLGRIEAGVREADAGEFATDEEVAAVFARWLNAPPMDA